MITNDQNKALLIVGNAAAKKSEWILYANYCFDREKGLRKEAFKQLDSFLVTTIDWTMKQKIEFLNFLFPIIESVFEAGYGPFPQPLNDRLIKPSLIDWCEIEKNDGNPFRWYGKYYRSEEHLFKALEIDPSDDLSRQTIINWWSHRIYFSVHHLPDGYIGEPFEDIKLGDKIKEQIQLLTSPELRETWTKELDEDLKLVKNYIEWRTTGTNDFEKWGQQNKKQTRYGITRVYYYEK